MHRTATPLSLLAALLLLAAAPLRALTPGACALGTAEGALTAAQGTFVSAQRVMNEDVGPTAADIREAAAAMGSEPGDVYTPIPENVAAYEELFQEYRTLHDYFGRGANDVMHRLKAIQRRSATASATPQASTAPAPATVGASA